MRGLKFCIREFDSMFQTQVEAILDTLLEYFWRQHPKTRSKIFEVQGVPVDDRIFTSAFKGEGSMQTMKTLFTDGDKAAVPLLAGSEVVAAVAIIAFAANLFLNLKPAAPATI